MSELRISELAAKSGVPSTTLRYYEDVGLLVSARTPSGYRTYDQRAVERLRFIGAAKRMHLSLDSIRDLLSEWDAESCRSVKARLRPMVSSRLAEAERGVAALTDLAEGLRARLLRLDALPDRDESCDPSCAFLDLAAVPPEPAQHDRGCHPERNRGVLACSLSHEDHSDRIARWHHLLKSPQLTTAAPGVIASVPVDASCELASLVVAEQECCPFLGFRLDFLGVRIDLHITAPSEEGRPFVEALLPDSVK